jgi:hypothetical protein
MNRDSVHKIESALGVKLPASYLAALVHCHFSRNTVPGEMFCQDTDFIISQNQRQWRQIPRDGNRCQLPNIKDGFFYIGMDGGEHEYYLNLQSPSAVFEYDFETGGMSTFSSSLDAYLERIHQIENELENCEHAEEERVRANPKWRQTLHFYKPVIITFIITFIILPATIFAMTIIWKWLFK